MDEWQKQEIYNILDKVCKSSAFTNSGRNIRLLKFLVQKAIDGEFVKEHVVGFELFEKDYNPNDRNSKVRVYMYKLRQKLDGYYQEEGKLDALKFEIRKGQYNLQFIENPGPKKLKFVWLKIAIPTILLLGIVTYGALKLNKAPNLWDSFFNSKNETICFISDHFIVTKKNSGCFVFYTHITC